METNLQNEPYDDSRMNHFRCLSFEAQAGAIRRLAATGMTLQGISHATGIAVEHLATMISNNPRSPA
jgi:hypothetical protein